MFQKDQKNAKTAIIIGGGIGGVSAAIALRRAGIDATVYERAPALQEVGSAIPLWANALNALRKLGVVDSLGTLGKPVNTAKVSTWRGELLADVSHEKKLQELGTISVVVHRAELLDVLLAALGEEHVRLGTTCVGFSQDEQGVNAHFADGTQARGDILIGADGIHSTIRSAWSPQTRPHYVGYTCWRGIAHIERSGLETWSWGKGCQFGITPMTRGRAYWFAQKYAPEGQQEPEGTRKDGLLSLFHDWHDPIPEVIKATAEHDILRNDIYELPALRHWYNGRVTLLGDAAHAMTPNLGQGGCLAIEDAVVLADCLRAETDIVSAFKPYEQRRRVRAHRVARIAHYMGQTVQVANPVFGRTRDTLIKHVPLSLALNGLMWILAYQP
jgi:2-polyprenyl-6-methoxyphenol hydroxylase-like FAD-dependent oxidoreductase